MCGPAAAARLWPWASSRLVPAETFPCPASCVEAASGGYGGGPRLLSTPSERFTRAQRPIIVFDVNETVRRYKPAPEAYHSVAAALELDPGDICLVACHVWDTIGAQAAGCQAALILRQGNAPLPAGPQPGYIGKDLDAIADQLIEQYATAANASRQG